MSNPLIILDSNLHRQHGWRQQTDCGFAAADTCVPITLAELGMAMPHYPLGFVKDTEQKFQLVAVLGLTPKTNLFVDGKGRWQATYIPSQYRSYPFGLLRLDLPPSAEDQPKQTRLVLCFNQESGLYREQPDDAKGEQRFFNEDGQLQPYLQQILQFLTSCQQNRLLTQTAVDALTEADMLEPWSLAGHQPDAATPPLQGLYRINEAAFNQIDAELLLRLRSANALPVVYAQLLSMARLRVLQALAKQRQQQTQVPSTDADALADALRLVGCGESDTLKFSW